MIALLENERIVLKRRRHWLVVVLELVPIVLAAIFPLAALVIGSTLPMGETIISQYPSFIIFFLAAWWLLLWSIFFIIWTNYYLDILVVTNKRIIDIEQLGLFARDIAEVRMENIEDVKTEVVGIVASLLDMGNVHIQTAGEARELVVKRIANPHKVREIISKCHDESLSMRR